VKHSVPRSVARSPRLRQSRERLLRKKAASTRRKPRQRAGNTRSTGARNHSGGRSRSNASRVSPAGRSQGLAVVAALARRKLEAPPDAGHEPREGEPVLRESAHPKVRTRPGPAAKAGGSSIRRKVLSGSRPPCPHRLCEAKSLARRSTSLMRPARARVTGDSASVGTEAGRACLRVTTGASEVGAVSVKAPRGPRRTEGGQHPPALKRRRDSGAPERMRPKLTTANSFVDPPLS
jgi:hypothetical protein